MQHPTTPNHRVRWAHSLAGMLVVAGLFLAPSGADAVVSVVGEPARWDSDHTDSKQVGGRAHRFELDDPGRTNGMSVWYFLAYVIGSDRLTAHEHSSPTTLGPDSVIARSQNVAWHVAAVLLGRTSGVARPGELPEWAVVRTGNNDGRSAGLLFALAYLDLLSEGALAGDLVVAATGAIASDGRVTPVRRVDVKLAAARLTHPDVVFAPAFPAGSGAVTDVRSRYEPSSAGRTVGDSLDTAGYEDAGRRAASEPGIIALVPVDDIRQALAWLCGRTQRPGTCELAREAADVAAADVRPEPAAPVAPAHGPQ